MNLPVLTDGATSDAMAAWLAALSMCRIDEVYETASRDPERLGLEHHDPDRPRRLAAVVAAYHSSVADVGTPLVFGWARPASGGPVTLFATATPVQAATGPAALSFPPGSRGRRYPAAEAGALLASVPCWTRLDGIVDGLLVENSHRSDDFGARPSLVDSLLGAWRGPFAWLLVATPAPPADVGEEAARVARLEREARTRTSSPEYAVLASRLELRHRELRMAESTGLWRVSLLAAGADPAGSLAVAGLLSAAADLTGLPYVLKPDTVVDDFDTVLARSTATAFLAGSPLVAALARPPAVEIPGIRVIPRPTFDVTPETGTGHVGVNLGEVIDRDGVSAGQLHIPMDSLNRHTFVCGATGGGKSQTIRHLLEEISAAGLPWLVIEPAKAEYRRMSHRLPDTEVFVVRPGDPAVPPVGINPLEPAHGFPLQTHADLTRALFIAAFQAEEPFPQVLAAALIRCYERLGWDLTLGEPVHPGVRPRYPTLGDLQVAAEEVVEAIGYGREVTDNVRGFIAVRLASLRLGTTGRFFEGGHRLDLDRLVRRNVVLEIEDVGDDRDKAFLMGAMLIQLVEYLRVQDRQRPHGGGLRHLTVIEEAHRLLRRPDQPGPAAHAVELFAALLAEVRAYGEGLVIAEQIPAKLIPDVIKNTAVKVVHRLPARDDRETVGATMNLTDAQSRFLVTLPPGTGAVFADGMDHPILTVIPDGSLREARSASDSALARGSAMVPTGLIAEAAEACPPLCASDPCPLRRMTGARRLLKTEPRLALWAELAVLGHLAGMPAPAPSSQMRAALVNVEPRLLDCAVRHATDGAVAARSAALVSSHSPKQFAGHVSAELRALLAGAAGCTDAPGPWLAPCFQWNPVRLALQDLHTRDPLADRHPDSDQWAAKYGQPIVGDSCREQLGTVRRWCIELLRERNAVNAVIYGLGAPSALETAIGSTRGAANWRAMVTRAIADLAAYRNWPAAFLAPTKPSTR
jgi:DNA helicase HerA-like ATPase